MANLPYTISIPSLDAVVVHAGLLPDRPLHDQIRFDMTNMRSIEPSSKPYKGHEKGAKQGSENVPWVSMWKQRPHVYFGHDAKAGLQQTEYCTGLDSGCCYGIILFITFVKGQF
jgi:hypothetical protein